MFRLKYETMRKITANGPRSTGFHPGRAPSILSGRRMTKQSGLTLIEVLIALLVLSIGLIGIAALHLVSLQNANSSFHSSMASSIALDFEERLWLQLTRLPEGQCIEQADATAIAGTLQTLWRGGALTDIGGGQGTNAAIPDVRLVAAAVAPPAGTNSRSLVSLTISWDDDRFEDNVNTFVHQARVPCYRPPADGEDNDGN